jgi:hypothetical protein
MLEDGFDIWPVGQKLRYRYENNSLLMGDISDTAEKRETIFEEESKLMLIYKNPKDTIFLIRDSHED